MATDGLWDFLGAKDVAEVLHKNSNESNSEIATKLFNTVIDKAAHQAGMPVDELMAMKAGGYKRGIHDDITLIVFNLK